MDESIGSKNFCVFKNIGSLNRIVIIEADLAFRLGIMIKKTNEVIFD